MLGAPIDRAEATVEDLVSRDAYIEAVGKTGRSAKLTADEAAEPTNVAAMQKLFRRKGWGSFGIAEKAAAALKLIEIWGRDSSSVPNKTRTMASALFAAINQRFD